MADTKQRTAAAARNALAATVGFNRCRDEREAYHRTVTGQVTRQSTLFSLYE
jgi:hypothetical protein